MLAELRAMLSSEVSSTSTQSKRLLAARKHYVIDQDGVLCQRSLRYRQASRDMEEVLRKVVPLTRRAALLEAYHTMPTFGHKGHQTLY